MNFFERAKQTVERGVPVIRLLPRSKAPMDTDWPSLATTDLTILEKWNSETPEANCGSVAKAELGGTWYFEFDAPEVAQRVFADTQKKLPDTFKIRSSPGKGHIYFRQSTASIAMGNIAQGYVNGGDWSARVDRQFVVSADSLHPKTGLPYEIRSLAPIVEAPQWFIDWCISQKIKEKSNVLDDENEPILEGGRNARLTSICGKLRQAGLNREALEIALLDMNQKRCQPPLSDEEVKVICGSISKYPAGREDVVLIGGKIAGSNGNVPAISVEEAEEPIPIVLQPYPKFPTWVMKGTSCFENLVDPFCQVNSRYPEFMFVPAMVLLLNYVGAKIRVEMKNLNTSIFMVSIGRAGRVIKSSCVEDAIRYFEYAGLVGHGDHSINNSDGRALVFTPSSPEGLGKEMSRLNCRNGIMFFDELSTLTEKAKIENSTLGSSLLTLYESGKFQRIVKSPKDSFSLLPGAYCASLIACSTDKNFTSHWSKLAGNSSGLNDRFFFLLQPEKLKDLTEYIHVDTQIASSKTRQMVDKALAQGVYRIADTSPLNKFLKENDNGNRAEIRAEKFALYFAIDLGLDGEIDEECLERALALVDYEMKVKKYLRVYEADTKEGAIQTEILYQIRNASGRMQKRDLERVAHAPRYGTSMWRKSYVGLIQAGYIREEGTGKKNDPVMVVLLRLPEEDD